MVARPYPEYLTKILAAPAEAVALRSGDKQLSYGELRAAAAVLSEQLDAHLHSPAARVGVCMDRGLAAPIALLATLLAGHTYVPLDRSYPAQRLARMAELAQLNGVIADAALPWLAEDVPTLQIRADELVTGATSAAGERKNAVAELAYIIFTSGSTGLPKAVAMPHQALNNLLQWQSSDSAFAQPANVLQFTPISFDVHFQEIFHTWASHGCVTLIDDDIRRDPVRLIELMISAGVERLYLPYVALSQMAYAGVNGKRFPVGLKDVVTAGEQLVVNSSLRAFFEALPGCRLHNQYGPSETHVVTAHTLDGPVRDWPELPPIGTPIDDCWIEFVDTDEQSVPRGHSGEMYIGGECLAQGYFAAPELTAERFVQSSRGPAYRTGDLGRVDAEGVISYLGRTDNQVKIRGHRIEPGEIEACILKDISVTDCAVVARTISADEQALMAYIVLDRNADPEFAQLDSGELDQWQQVWDTTYLLDADQADPRFDIRGWNSSFTGLPLATQDMRVWVEQTCDRILRLQPKRILELGCGTGLFAFALAPQCEHYHATDYSAVTITQLQDRVSAVPEIREQVQVSQLAADSAHQRAQENFDLVLINSLTQHFVSVAYLDQVIESAIAALAGHGRIFFGDITSKTTRGLYYAAVEQTKLSASQTGADLTKRVFERLANEQELVLDPRFFFDLPGRFEQVTDVNISLKGGGYDNELADYRYDVVLDIGQPREQSGLTRRPSRTRAWDEFGDIEAFASWLNDHDASTTLRAGQALLITDIPNTRVAGAAALLKVAVDEPSCVAGTLLTRADSIAHTTAGIDPQALLEISPPADSGFVNTYFSARADAFNVLVTPQHWSENSGSARTSGAELARLPGNYASAPVSMDLFARVESRLRQELSLALPEYMQPLRFVALSELPLTPSGKVDRLKLPQPSTARPVLSEPYAAPANELQEKIAKVWQDILLLDQIGVNDNFFDLGGSSIQSLKVVAQVGQLVARPVPIVALFQSPTVALLAAKLIEPGAAQSAANRSAERKQIKQSQASAVAAHRRRLNKRRR